MSHVRHFVERRRDQSAQPDDVRAPCLGLGQNLFARHHHAHVENFVIVAAQYHADDILADVVHVALDRRQQHFALRFSAAAFALLVHERQQHRDRFFHHARALDNLRQKHFSSAEQIADDIHPRHQRTFDHQQRPHIFLPRLLHIRLDEIDDALDQRVRQSVFDGLLAPGLFLDFDLVLFLHRFGEGQQPVGGIRAAIQQHVLDQLQQIFGNLVVHGDHARVDDAHVQSRFDRVIQKRRVHRFAHDVVAAEAERNVADPAADFTTRQRALDLARRFDEIHRVIVVLVHARRHGQDVRIEDDVSRWKSDFIDQDAVRAGADFDFARLRVGLPFFVEGHDHDRRAIAPDQARLFAEFILAFFKRNRIHDALALRHFQAGFKHRPF